MTLFVDASAIVAIMTDETDGDALLQRLALASRRLYSPIASWEAATAVGRKRTVSATVAAAEVTSFAAEMQIDLIAIGAPELSVAMEAYGRYGRRSGSPAELNMGDCFAYACARTNNARLLYKGDDFARTDLA